MPLNAVWKRGINMISSLVTAFIVGGLICVVGQILMDVFKLTPAHTLSTLVVSRFYFRWIWSCMNH